MGLSRAWRAEALRGRARRVDAESPVAVALPASRATDSSYRSRRSRLRFPTRKTLAVEWIGVIGLVSPFKGSDRMRASSVKLTVGPLLVFAVSSCGSSAGGGDASADAATSQAESGPTADGASQNEEANDSAACPVTLPTPSCSVSCTTAQASENCYYEGWCCTCGYLDAFWMCQQTNAPAPCPTAPPADGTACGASMACSYCQPTGLLNASCEVGTAGPGRWSVVGPGDACEGPGH